MAKIIAFMNMKGGVCKTTLCVNIANTLATSYSKKVLLIDMDPQYNATQIVFTTVYGEDHLKHYDELRKSNRSIYGLFKQPPVLSSSRTELQGMFNTFPNTDESLSVAYWTNIKNNFDMIVGDINMIELQISERKGMEHRLRHYIDIQQLKEKYDYILIDSPPTYSFYFIASFMTCDAYVVPLKPDGVSALGLDLLNEAINSLKSSWLEKESCVCNGIIYTLIDPRNSLHNSVIEEFRKRGIHQYAYRANIKYYTDIPKGPELGRFMLDINEHDINTSIKLLTEEFIQRNGGD